MPRRTSGAIAAAAERQDVSPLGAHSTGYNQLMSEEQLAAAALSLDPESRARLAEKLLESLYDAEDKRLEQIWAEEAKRRDAEWDTDPSTGRAAVDVLREARSKLR